MPKEKDKLTRQEDAEMSNLISEQKTIESIVNHEGWSILRKRFTDRILELQNAFEIDDRTATTMLRDLQARKKASEILFDFLRDIEGTSDQAKENLPNIDKGYIIRGDK